jgi:hypothetical protein
MRLRQRALRATALAPLAALVMSTAVFTGANLVRVKVVQVASPSNRGSILVNTAGFPEANLLRPPFALIARIRNGSTGTSRFSIVVDGAPVCERSISGGGARRVDCAVTGTWNQTIDHRLSIEGPANGWTLDYLELATHHGSTGSGANSLLVLPAAADHYSRPRPGWIGVTCAIILVAILILPEPEPLPRIVLHAYRVVAPAILLLLMAIPSARWVSDYRIALSAGTLIRWSLLLVLPWLWSAGRWLVRMEPAAADRRTSWCRAVIVAALVVTCYDAVVRARVNESYRGNYSGLLMVARQAFDRNPILNTREDVRASLVLHDSGYDGQYMYFSAFDPLLRRYRDAPSTYRKVMDSAPYRYGRIGFGLLTIVFSAGQWQRFPWTMTWLIMASLFSAALLLARMAQSQSLSPALGASVLLVPGFWQSLQLSLPEPIAAAAFLGGVLFISLSRWWPAAVLFALSLLVRETGIVGVGCITAGAMLSGNRRQALVVGAAAAGALLLWRLYVAWVLFPEWGIEGFLFNPANLGRPFVGILEMWRLIARGQYYPGVPELSRAAIAYPILLVGGLALAIALAVVKPNAVHTAAVVYGVIAISLNFPAIWVHVGNAQRGTYELFVMLALSGVGIRTYPGSIRVGLIIFWAAAAFYELFLALDAGYIRSLFSFPF